MERKRGTRTDRLRGLLRGGISKRRPAGEPAPHIPIPAGPPAREFGAQPETPRSGVLATLERWGRLDAPLPDELMRRGLAAMDLDLAELAAALHFDDRGYQRTRIYRSSHLEAFVLCWRPGQASPIHDHRGSTCGMLVLRGVATETLFEASPCGRLVPTRSYPIPEGAVAIARGGDVHAIANLQAEGRDLISLHVFSPPAPEGRCYRLAETAFGGNDDALDHRPPTRDVRL